LSPASCWCDTLGRMQEKFGSCCIRLPAVQSSLVWLDGGIGSYRLWLIALHRIPSHFVITPIYRKFWVDSTRKLILVCVRFARIFDISEPLPGHQNPNRAPHSRMHSVTPVRAADSGHRSNQQITWLTEFLGELWLSKTPQCRCLLLIFPSPFRPQDGLVENLAAPPLP
jgi:hypothetical protein